MADVFAEELYRHIGERISNARQQRSPKMSQQSLARAVGISRASIANIERGHHRVQIHVLYDIATTLNLDPVDLLPNIQNGTRSSLPPDLSKDLSPKERAAVGRLLQDGKEVQRNDSR